jgi:hypothetical protein
MRSINVLLVCLCLSLSTAIHAQEKGWRGIKPLQSTREEVERVIGTSTEQSPVLYKLDDVIVVIDYVGNAPCGSERASGWKVPPGTVITIAMHFKTRINFSDLKIDTSKYKKIDDPELPSNYHYVNTEEGIDIQVSGSTVEGMSYFPTVKDNYLRCPNSPAKQTRDKASGHP